MNSTIYDSIGRGYVTKRVPDPNWERLIHNALGDAASVLNVGAGTGSYEPADRHVVALEPSLNMIAQRPVGTAPIVCGVAEALPFGDKQFDATLAILTIHHWLDYQIGIDELRRVSQRQVIVTWDPAVFLHHFWLVRDYVPEAADRERAAGMVTLPEIHRYLGLGDVSILPVGANCSDGFFGAYWRRPEAYLDPEVRQSISGLALLDQELLAFRLRRLEQDLKSGQWHQEYSDLLDMESIDLGYRLLTVDH